MSNRAVNSMAYALALLVAAACGGVQPSTTSSPVTLASNSLPTLPPGPAPTCAGVGLTEATVRGDRMLANPVWFEVATEGQARRSLPTVWPFGYTARFVPNLEVVDPTGDVIAREGTVLKELGVCVGQGDEVLVWSIGQKTLVPTP
jgi:hypothetical protein